MLVTSLTAKVRKDAESLVPVELDFQVDPAATVTVVPGKVLTDLGVAPTGEEKVSLGNGQTGTRQVGQARLEVQGRNADVKVAFGVEGDRPGIAPAALAACGLAVEPETGRLTPRS